MACYSTSSNSEVSTDSNCSSSCLENVKILSEQNKQLLKDLKTSKINAITYKRGLEYVEARLLVYKKNEFDYDEDIKLLQCEIYLKEVAITELRRKLELAQIQKDEIQLIVNFFENSSESLNKLIDCQIVDKCKTGLGSLKNFGLLLIEDWTCDGVGGYDWSEQAEEGPTNFALMAYSSTIFDSEGNPQQDLQDKGVIDSGCSRHMIGNISYLRDYEEINGGYVAFGGTLKGRKITGRGTKACDDAGKARMETSSQDDGLQPSSDDGNKVNEDPRQESECKDQEKEDNVNSTNNVNVADISTLNFSSDHEDEDEEANMNNLDTSIQVSLTLTTRIHKDYPIEQVIGDLHSTTQTRNMSKNLEEHWGIVIRNKARLVAQGHIQEEGIDYDEVFAPVSRIKAIRLFLAYASFKDFVVYQMDIKCVFLYGNIKEEVYVCQPLGFEDPDFPDKVYKVEKALYGLHQAPRAWYETLSTYLLDNGFHKEKIDKTLFIRRHKDDNFLVQVYVDDIIFGLTTKELCNALEKMMQEKFQIELKNVSTLMETQKPLLKDEDKEVDVHMYRSMIGSLMYLTYLRPDIMFANANLIKYALAVNPTVYTSCIEQFWATVKAKTVNGEVQLQALVDEKKVIITESTIRRDLQLEAAKGVDCLPNAAIFE
uniref:Reverse transcriptase Ty1/copia-type domain-containing protein n=1 Tax=Tanacetum cinerariifolium TaxID=118510 RepID=A0A6L2L1H7_TANCI|nr:hypothetical protein [Tanacetum cinerariifolium]